MHGCCWRWPWSSWSWTIEVVLLEDLLLLADLADLAAQDLGKLAGIRAIPMENCRLSSFLGLTVAWTVASIGTRRDSVLLVGDPATIVARQATLLWSVNLLLQPLPIALPALLCLHVLLRIILANFAR